MGDIHGDADGMYKWLLAWEQRTGTKLDALVHVGDFGIYLPLTETDSALSFTHFDSYWYGRKTAPIPTWVCPGNHDGWLETQAWLREPNRIPNMHLLPNGEITDVIGVKVGAIWGNYSFKSWNNAERIYTARRNHPYSPKTMHIEQSAVRRLQRAGEFDVLITHDAPSNLMKPMNKMSDSVAAKLGLDDEDEGKAVGCPGFNELYESGHPKAHFFGHFHTPFVCRESNPLVVCLTCFHFNQDKAFWPLEHDVTGDLVSHNKVLTYTL